MAVALEFAHNGTLIIDNIEDDATLRRGKPVSHQLFGLNVAINSGNAMYFQLSEEKKIRLLKILGLHTKKRRLLKERMEIIRQSGAVEKSVACADELIDKAWQQIEPMLPENNPAALEEFKSITYFLVKRTS